MLNLKRIAKKCFFSKDILKKYNFQKILKLLKKTPLSGHFSKTVRGRETYKHFLDTQHRDKKKVIPGKNAYR